MDVGPQVEFRSGSFPADPDEAELINPGCHGRRLAYWVQAELQARSIESGEPLPEDWGWMVELRGDGAKTWIGCGNIDDEADGLTCFVAQSRRWLRRPGPDDQARVDEVVAALDDALARHPDVTDIRWSRRPT